MELRGSNAVFIINANDVSLGENVGESPRLIVARGEDEVLRRVQWKWRDSVFVDLEFRRAHFFFVFVVPNANRAVIRSRNGDRTVLMQRDGSDRLCMAWNQELGL